MAKIDAALQSPRRSMESASCASIKGDLERCSIEQDTMAPCDEDQVTCVDSCSIPEVVSEPKSKLSRPYVIGVCGGTASGKTTVCHLFQEYLKDESVAFVPSDAFYKALTAEQKADAMNSKHDFDHPDSIDWDGVKQCIETLQRGHESVRPIYDFTTHGPVGVMRIPPADVIIVEGILIYSADQELRDMMDLKVFVDCDADVRLARRLTRDVAERGRDCSGVISHYMEFVKSSYETYVDPSKKYSDIIVPNIGTVINMVAVEVLVQQIRHQLECRRIAKTHSQECLC